ncbi:hypothetical protein EGW08_009596 [Elysia chlorotica]|uniref:Uncharacterized protein n=1 Tax=Elysia chlorotica TaxID=188477 RepID=A0A3S1BFR9_ELYCH|nr:hypothetical protein EGW08_009596 [Elysia chlorotica]
MADPAQTVPSNDIGGLVLREHIKLNSTNLETEGFPRLRDRVLSNMFEVEVSAFAPDLAPHYTAAVSAYDSLDNLGIHPHSVSPSFPVTHLRLSHATGNEETTPAETGQRQARRTDKKCHPNRLYYKHFTLSLGSPGPHGEKPGHAMPVVYPAVASTPRQQSGWSCLQSRREPAFFEGTSTWATAALLMQAARLATFRAGIILSTMSRQ